MLAVQDRTQEFRSCVASLAKINMASARGQIGGRATAVGAPIGLTTANGLSDSSPRSEFASRASHIAKEIGETTEMLQRLAVLAKRKSLFDDRPVEITELTHVIKQKVSSINQSIAALQRNVKETAKSNMWGSNKGEKQLAEHSRNVVVLLQGRLTDVTTGFAEVLETRTKNIQASKSRTEQFISTASHAVGESPLYGTSAPGSGPPSALASRNKSPVASNRNGSTASRMALSENPYESSVSLNPYESNESNGAAADYLALPEQQQTMALLEEQQDSYLSSRNTAVEAIESTMQELGNIFSQLSTMVAEQRDVVQRIDANTEDIALNVSSAQRELLKYYARISSNRWLFVKMFSIIIVFFLLWVMVS